MKGVEQIEHSLHNLASPKRSHTFWGLMAVLFITALILLLQHGYWLRNANDVMFGPAPDGFKNYMTSAWHVRYDSSYVHYEGMNYPYGEHVLFTDNQPILTAGIQWWSRHISDLQECTVGIVNVFQVLSMLFAAGILFLLLRKLHLPVWYAALVALGMLFLSPQYRRFEVHFGLSHIWVFPLLLLILCRYEERHSRRYQSLQIGFLVWIAAQLHFYYFGLAAIFLGFYTAYQLLTDPSARNFRVRISHLVVMVVLPFALLNLWMHWTDFAADRPANPYGFTTYLGEWEGVFLPYEHFPLFQWIDTHLIKIRRVNGETMAYAGAVAFLFTLWLLGSGFRMFGKSWDEAAYHRVHKRYLKGIFVAALAVLLFACGFPFAIHGLEWTLDYLGPLRQFRGLGRFTWAYYYVINVLAFYVFWNVSVRFQGFRGGKAPWFRWVIALAPLALLGYEAVLLQQMQKHQFDPNIAKRSIAAADPNHWLNKVDFSKYQALLPLPYYHIGSENLWLDFDSPHFRKVQMTALYTGLPDMGVNMSRTAISQMLKSVQLTLEPCQEPAILDDLPDNRPIAMMVEPSKWEEVKRRYPHLLRHAVPLYDSPEISVLGLYPDSLRARAHEYAQDALREMQGQSLDKSGVWGSTNSAKPFVYQSFDSLTTAAHIFQGKGAFQGDISDTVWIWQQRLPKGYYYISLWVYANQDMGMTQEIKIVENNRADGHEVHFKHEGLRFYLRSIVNGWALFDMPFEVFDDNANVRIFLPPKNARGPFYLDEVLIKPADVFVFRQEPGWVVRNNFWYAL